MMNKPLVEKFHNKRNRFWVSKIAKNNDNMGYNFFFNSLNFIERVDQTAHNFKRGYFGHFTIDEGDGLYPLKSYLNQNIKLRFDLLISDYPSFSVLHYNYIYLGFMLHDYMLRVPLQAATFFTKFDDSQLKWFFNSAFLHKFVFKSWSGLLHPSHFKYHEFIYQVPVIFSFIKFRGFIKTQIYDIYKFKRAFKVISLISLENLEVFNGWQIKFMSNFFNTRHKFDLSAKNFFLFLIAFICWFLGVCGHFYRFDNLTFDFGKGDIFYKLNNRLQIKVHKVYSSFTYIDINMLISFIRYVFVKLTFYKFKLNIGRKVFIILAKWKRG